MITIGDNANFTVNFLSDRSEQSAFDSSNRITWQFFTLICFGAFFYAIAYGVTFLIPLLIGIRGGGEDFAGLIISAATVSTVLIVIFCGHITDRIGLTKSIMLSGGMLALSALGFAVTDSLGFMLIFYGFIFGIGWGVFYTLGPILIAAIIDQERRIKFFALLSGSMMTGIGTGPLLGRLVSYFDYPVEFAFGAATVTSIIGTVLFIYVYRKLRHNENMQRQPSNSISVASTLRIVRSNAIFPICMVGLGGVIFGGLSSFQTVYADYYQFDYSLFFIGFTLAVISCRLLVAGYVVKRDPLISSFILSTMIVLALFAFIGIDHGDHWAFYLTTSIVLGIGYGLIYSVINGQAANEAPANLVPQSLLLFSLSYFIGIFGSPYIVGKLITHSGLDAMLYLLLSAALLNNAITIFRLLRRRVER